MAVTLDIRDLDAGVRLDKWLASRFPERSREGWKAAIREGAVRINGEEATPSRILAAGDRLELPALPSEESLLPQPQQIDFGVLYEDDYLAVIEKPAGLAVHPSHGHADGTLVNAILARFPGRLSDQGGKERPGIVHRLDKDTSGVMLIALDNKTHEKLARLFREGRVGRHYQAMVRGIPDVPRGLIDLPIGRGGVNRRRMEVKADGRPSQTEFEVLAKGEETSRLALSLLTGRTHQIRVHLAHIGYPVVGDPVYGGRPRPDDPDYQLLHAVRLTLKHPVTGEELDISSPLPERFLPFMEEEVLL